MLSCFVPTGLGYFGRFIRFSIPLKRDHVPDGTAEIPNIYKVRYSQNL